MKKQLNSIIIYKILLPYVNSKREELRLPSSYSVIAVYDCFEGQSTNDVLQILKENHIDTLHHVQTDCSHYKDVPVNKSAKCFFGKNSSFGI